MIRVKIEGLEELKRDLGDVRGRQIPFAAAVALTRTAKSVDARLQSDMATAFKSPSPFIRRSTFSTSAKKSNLSAVVGLKDARLGSGVSPAILLKEHFSGGERGRKPFEKAIAQIGGLPVGYRAMPSGGIRLDAYGNPSRKEISEMLGGLRSRMQTFKGRGKKMTLIGYFIVPVGGRSHLPPGIYKRFARDVVRAMFVFVQKAAYTKIMDMERSASDVVSREFNRNFAVAFADAQRTAR